MSTETRILSIQSHVVHGYVGNKSASFPLQVLGFEVDQINSVQFSNHKGYPHCTGNILDAEQLGEVYEGLKSNALTSYTHLMTGYIGSESFLRKIVDIVKDLRKTNPSLIYVCDPVMGDQGKMYVPKELLPIYQKEIVPLADVLTPNQYEAELLTDVQIGDVSTARRAMERLHDMGAQTVVISSSDLGNHSMLVALASSVSNGTKDGIRIDIPMLPVNFTGTGDLFAALLTAWLRKHSNNLQTAIENTVASMQSILHRTLQHSRELAGPDKEPSRAQLELRLIQSKHDIESPHVTIHAQALS